MPLTSGLPGHSVSSGEPPHLPPCPGLCFLAPRVLPGRTSFVDSRFDIITLDAMARHLSSRTLRFENVTGAHMALARRLLDLKSFLCPSGRRLAAVGQSPLDRPSCATRIAADGKALKHWRMRTLAELIWRR